MRAPWANYAGRRVIPVMIAVILVPVCLLGVLLGLERLERWTDRQQDEARANLRH